jgi:cell division protease FtsH
LVFREEFQLNNLIKNVGIWLVIALVLMTLFNQFSSHQSSSNVVDYSNFIDQVKQGHVESVTIDGRTIKGRLSDGKPFVTHSPSDPWLVSDLLKYGVKITAKPEEEPSLLMNIFVSWFPMLLLIGVWVFFMRQMQGGGRGGAFSFGKSRARMLDENSNQVTFADVAGVDEAKEEVAELVEQPRYRQDPARARDRGRGQGPVLQHFRFRLCRDVRRCGRGAGARHVRSGEEERAMHCIHR